MLPSLSLFESERGSAQYIDLLAPALGPEKSSIWIINNSSGPLNATNRFEPQFNMRKYYPCSINNNAVHGKQVFKLLHIKCTDIDFTAYSSLILTLHIFIMEAADL